MLITYYNVYARKTGYWSGSVIATSERAARSEFCKKYSVPSTRGLSFARFVKRI